MFFEPPWQPPGRFFVLSPNLLLLSEWLLPLPNTRFGFGNAFSFRRYFFPSRLI